MRRLFVILSIVALLFCFSTVAMAEDVLIDKKIQSITNALDKNGNPYVRIIVNEMRKMNGVEYEVGVAVMAFSSTVDVLKKLKLTEGDTLKAICASRLYKENKSYTILKVVP